MISKIYVHITYAYMCAHAHVCVYEYMYVCVKTKECGSKWKSYVSSYLAVTMGESFLPTLDRLHSQYIHGFRPRQANHSLTQPQLRATLYCSGDSALTTLLGSLEDNFLLSDSVFTTFPFLDLPAFPTSWVHKMARAFSLGLLWQWDNPPTISDKTSLTWGLQWGKME